MEERKFNWYYLLVGLMVAAMLIVGLKFFQGTGHSSVGITAAREYKINAEKSAFIKSVSVVPGQQVKKGDLLIELTSHDLDIQIDKISNHLTVLQSEQKEKAKLAQSEIAFIRAEQGIEIEKINSEILQAEGELRLNRQLTKAFTSSRDSGQADDPVRMKISALKKQRLRHEEATTIKIKDIIQEDETEQRLLQNQMQLLEKELNILKEERESLNKYASTDGVVQNVYAKPGEQVEAFSSLLSINPVHPTTVVGYLVGKKQELPIGSSVSVRSFEHKHVTIPGKVIGYGAVVELPEILQKSTAVKAFGREVFIEIEAVNNFATGEKVLIK